MKLAIGDIHGKECWKKLVDKDYDDLYFVGDYFDNYENTPAVQQIRNFKEICELARNDSRVHLCIGNHDYHYLRGLGKSESYSGFQWYSRFDIQEVLEQNFDLLNVIYLSNDTIISHAGVTKTFLSNCNCTLENLNQKFKENRILISFDDRCYDPYGDDPCSSPIWVRPRSLLKDCVDEYKQIVGHTKYKEITHINNITFIDCLDTKQEIYEF